jgi:transcriptional regulator with XRE-family HTH domain
MTQAVVMPLIDPLNTLTIGEFCSSVRNREKLTQEDMGKLLGITRNSVNRAEMGMVERPYDYLAYIIKYGWITKRESNHMLNLLREIDIKHLYARTRASESSTGNPQGSTEP